MPLPPECIVLNYHLANVVALGTLKPAEVEAHAGRHDASQHHMVAALRASRALDMNVDVVGQGVRVWHDASLKEAGAQHSLSPVRACEQCGDKTTLDF
jgi:hypothetical protein